MGATRRTLLLRRATRSSPSSTACGTTSICVCVASGGPPASSLGPMNGADPAGLLGAEPGEGEPGRPRSNSMFLATSSTMMRTVESMLCNHKQRVQSARQPPLSQAQIDLKNTHVYYSKNFPFLVRNKSIKIYDAHRYLGRNEAYNLSSVTYKGRKQRLKMITFSFDSFNRA